MLVLTFIAIFVAKQKKNKKHSIKPNFNSNSHQFHFVWTRPKITKKKKIVKKNLEIKIICSKINSSLYL